MIIEETIVQLFEESKSSILESLRSQLIAKEYPKEWIDDIFRNIVITFSPTTSTVVHLSKITSNWQKETTPMQVEEHNDKQKKERDKTQYRLCDSLWENKRDFVLSFVKRYVSDTNLSYQELDKSLNSMKKECGHPVISTLEEAIKKRNRERSSALKKGNNRETSRYHFNDSLHSYDGVEFVVSNQWKINTIQPIIEFAKQQGYQVEERNPNKKE